MQIVRTIHPEISTDPPIDRELFIPTQLFPVLGPGLVRASDEAYASHDHDLRENLVDVGRFIAYAERESYAGLAMRGAPKVLAAVGAVMLGIIDKPALVTVREMTPDQYVHYASGAAQHLGALYATLSPDGRLLDSVMPLDAMVYDGETSSARRADELFGNR